MDLNNKVAAVFAANGAIASAVAKSLAQYGAGDFTGAIAMFRDLAMGGAALMYAGAFAKDKFVK